MICRFLDHDADGSLDDKDSEMFYHLTDSQFSTVAVLDANANLLERVSYDPYGRARHHWKADVDGDGDQDSGDISGISTLAGGGGTAITSGSYNADADIDRDGDIDSTDYSMANSDGTRAALLSGELSSSAVGNVMGYSGYVFNIEVYGGPNGGGTYTIRFRHYDTGLGRWLERDPLEYVDGMSMYQYVGGMPLRALDPFGLEFEGRSKDFGDLHVDYEVHFDNPKPEQNYGNVHLQYKNSKEKWYWDPTTGSFRDAAGREMTEGEYKRLMRRSDWKDIQKAMRNHGNKVRARTNRFLVGNKFVTVSAVVLALFLDSTLNLVFAFADEEVGRLYRKLLEYVQEGNEKLANEYAQRLYEELLTKAGSNGIPALEFQRFWEEEMAPRLHKEIEERDANLSSANNHLSLPCNQ